jgi:hypothetical protein
MINLSHTNIENITANNSLLTKIKESQTSHSINLSYNYIKEVDLSLFKNNYRDIDLSNNKITTIHFDCEKRNKIDLSNNNITKINNRWCFL